MLTKSDQAQALSNESFKSLKEHVIAGKSMKSSIWKQVANKAFVEGA